MEHWSCRPRKGAGGAVAGACPPVCGDPPDGATPGLDGAPGRTAGHLHARAGGAPRPRRNGQPGRADVGPRPRPKGRRNRDLVGAFSLGTIKPKLHSPHSSAHAPVTISIYRSSIFHSNHIHQSTSTSYPTYSFLPANNRGC